jgi:hypothetical protein
MKLLKQIEKIHFEHINKVFNMKSSGYPADVIQIAEFFPDSL